MQGLFSILIFSILVFWAGGIVMLIKMMSLGREVQSLKDQIDRIIWKLKHGVQHEEKKARTGRDGTPSPKPPTTDSSPPNPPIPTVPKLETAEDPAPQAPTPVNAVVLPERPQETSPSGGHFPSGETDSFEWNLGSKWLGWGGAVMLVLGVGFLLKYAYDRDLIGPLGRLGIGVFFGLVLILLGEASKRRGYKALFQTLIGGGIAIFYVCNYFSFHVYHVVGLHPALALTALITLFAVVLAVFHDALVIAVLALIGGFLGPFIFNIGPDRPYLLLSYVVLLDLVAFASAWFRQWRALAWWAFSGTQIVFWTWFLTVSEPTYRVPGLIFTTLFYLIFMLTPLGYGFVRRDSKSLGGLSLIGLNGVVTVLAFHLLLSAYPGWVMGTVVAGMAFGTLFLWRVWCKRLDEPGPTGSLLLLESLVLAIFSIPYLLDFYGVALAWAFEGVLFVLWGLRSTRKNIRFMGLIALALACFALLARLPLHASQFLPVFNQAFGSWAFVIAALLFCASYLYRERDPGSVWIYHEWLVPFSMAVGLLGFLGSLEVSAYWDFSPSPLAHNYRMGSLCVLWGIWTLVSAVATGRLRRPGWFFLLWTTVGIGWLLFMVAMVPYRFDAPWPGWNPSFLLRLFWVLALGGAAFQVRKSGFLFHAAGIESVGLLALFWLQGMEIARWAKTSEALSEDVGAGLVSATWAVLAFSLIWSGLHRDLRFRRVFGFAIFGIAAVKTVVFDLSDPIYKVISFLALGLFSLAAAYAYQRFRHRLMPEEKNADDST